MAIKGNRSQRLAKLRKIREGLENAPFLTQLQKALFKKLRRLLNRRRNLVVSPIEELDDDADMDEIEQELENAGIDEDGVGREDSEVDSEDEQGDQSDPAEEKIRKELEDKIKKEGKKALENELKRRAKKRAAEEIAKRAGKKVAENAARQAGKKIATKVVEQVATKAAGAALMAAGEAVLAFFATPPGWVTLIIIGLLLIGLLVVNAISAGGKNKIFSSVGGSAFVAADYNDAEARALVDKIKVAIHPAEGEPVLAFEAPASEDDLINWKDDGRGGKYLESDVRILRTVSYLLDRGWSKIEIGLSKSGGPDATRRLNVSTDGEQAYVDSISAFATGQAIAIVGLGKTTAELAKCLNEEAPVSVKVSWQETTADNLVRPLQEQLQVDGTNLYHDLELEVQRVLAGRIDKKNPGAKQTFDTTTLANIEKVKTGLSALRSALVATNGSQTATGYIGKALEGFEELDEGDIETSYQAIREALKMVFRSLSVANMQGWEGSTRNGCKLWKAYEARQNIRQLVKQILQMPFGAGGDATGFDSSILVKQLIVFSPEDDLDNGLPDLDVYPTGIVAVDVGGAGYDNSNRDDIVTEADNHLLALPMDNGIISKLSTVFFKELDGNTSEQLTEVLASLMVATEAERDYAELMDGGYESMARVFYKNFVQIGF